MVSEDGRLELTPAQLVRLANICRLHCAHVRDSQTHEQRSARAYAAVETIGLFLDAMDEMNQLRQ